jgi:hypothetical protein
VEVAAEVEAMAAEMEGRKEDIKAPN